MSGTFKIYPFNTERNYYFILILLALSLPLSIYTTSLAEILLLLNWIAGGNFREKLSRLWQEKSALVVTLVFFIHIIGLSYTRDFDYALHDLKTKLPLLVLPVIIGSSDPLDAKKLRTLLLLFCMAVVASSLVSAAVFFNLFNFHYDDYKTISIFISHIRLALMVDLSICILLYYASGRDESPIGNIKIRISLFVAAFWLACFLMMLKSVTGIVIFLVLFFILGWRYSGRIKWIAPKFILRVLILTVPLLIASWLSHTVARYYYREKLDFSSLEKSTPQGNPYLNDTTQNWAENGHYVWIYVCEKEMEIEWNKRSSLAYYGKDRRNQYLRFTLIRYLSSKGLRKDAEGVKALDPEDINAVENGIANYIFLNKFSLYPRIYQIIWELDNYMNGSNPSGHSVSQRLAYLDAAGHIIRENPVFGVGTGDVQTVFNKYYSSCADPLNPEARRRAHNQYITFMVTFGALGTIIILIALFLPVYIEKRRGDFLFLCFAIIGFLSMLNEDTLETQTGISFFMFFYSVFLYGRKRHSVVTLSDNK
jgi:hypothetical protein